MCIERTNQNILNVYISQDALKAYQLYRGKFGLQQAVQQ